MGIPVPALAPLRAAMPTVPALAAVFRIALASFVGARRELFNVFSSFVSPAFVI